MGVHHHGGDGRSLAFAFGLKAVGGPDSVCGDEGAGQQEQRTEERTPTGPVEEQSEE
jgi:hypothetical protein